MRNSIVVSAILLFCCFVLVGQETINSDRFFRMTVNELVQDDYLVQDRVRFPWIEEIDLRTETRDLDFPSQEYTLRVSPSTNKIRKAHTRLLEHYRSNPNNSGFDRQEDVIQDLYLEWLNLYFINREMAELKKQILITEDKRLIMDKGLEILDYSPKELVASEVERNRLKQNLFELELQHNRILGDESAERQLDFDDLIKVADIEVFLANIELTPPTNSTLETDYEKQELLLELELEQAEKRKKFDFVQLKYRGPHEEQIEERVSFGLGVKLPNSAGRKLKIQRLALEMAELDAEEKENAFDFNARLNESVLELKYNLTLYQHYNSLVIEQATNLENIEKAVGLKAGYDPMVILEINEQTSKSELKHLALLEDVYLSYIKCVRLAGYMFERPFKNYLKV